MPVDRNGRREAMPSAINGRKRLGGIVGRYPDRDQVGLIRAMSVIGWNDLLPVVLENEVGSNTNNGQLDFSDFACGAVTVEALSQRALRRIAKVPGRCMI